MLADVKVIGYLLHLEGTGTHLSLMNPMTHKVERGNLAISLKGTSERIALQPYVSEEYLSNAMEGGKDISIQKRIKLPRIRLGSVYWPPSTAATEKYLALYDPTKEKGGRIPSFEEIEGTQIEGAWRMDANGQNGT